MAIDPTRFFLMSSIMISMSKGVTIMLRKAETSSIALGVRILGSLLLALPIAACTNRPPPTSAGLSQPAWITLFDGESLNGWRVHGGEHRFKVADGVITGTAVADQPNAFLVTELTYSDFIFETDFLSDGSMNSGIMFRAGHDPEYREGRLFGYQAEIDPSPREWTGGLYEEALRGWLVPIEDGNPCKSSFKREEWNTMRIEAIGTDLRIFLNGIPCVHTTEVNLRDGVIGLQIHSVPPGGARGRPGDWSSWRNIRILTEDLERHRLPLE